MAFDILLQVNNSERERIDKDISTIGTISGVLKNETSIIDPIIEIEIDLSNVVNCNYITIFNFGRSYFVNDIRTIRNGLVELYCHCDVLSTYKNQIRSNSAIVRKQENNWNLYLNDGSFKVYQNPIVLTKAFPSGFNVQEFVLAIAGS